MKTLSTVTTPVGTFTRKTETNYTHIVVWASDRAMCALKCAQASGKSGSGVDARWAKDFGYGVTWHSSEANARKAAAGFYRWDRGATLVGVFAVDAEVVG